MSAAVVILPVLVYSKGAEDGALEEHEGRQGVGRKTHGAVH